MFKKCTARRLSTRHRKCPTLVTREIMFGFVFKRNVSEIGEMFSWETRGPPSIKNDLACELSEHTSNAASCDWVRAPLDSELTR